MKLSAELIVGGSISLSITVVKGGYFDVNVMPINIEITFFVMFNNKIIVRCLWCRRGLHILHQNKAIS